MKTGKLIGQILVIAFLLFPACIKAQFGDILSSVGNAVGTVVNSGVQMLTAPTQVVINSAKVATGNASPSTIYQPYQQIANTVGSGIPNAVDLVNRPGTFLYDKALAFSNNFGTPGKFVFDVATFSNQFYNQLGTSGANAVGNVLKGQNPFQVVAAPLAAAIRAARQRHLADAQPLPANIKQALAGYFSPSTLNRAKYCVGNVEITLPNFIGQGQKLFGNDYFAVTVDDIIVFNNQPPPYATSWWVHELTHVEQYERMGVEMFAYNYARDYNGIEREATQKANRFHLQSQEQTDDASMASTAPSQALETYTIQCFFWHDQYPVQYLVTNRGRIMAVDPVNGQSIQVGWSTPPRDNIAAWTYQTPNFMYAVTPQGGIFAFQPQMLPNGQFMPPQPVQIGSIMRLQ